MNIVDSAHQVLDIQEEINMLRNRNASLEQQNGDYQEHLHKSIQGHEQMWGSLLSAAIDPKTHNVLTVLSIKENKMAKFSAGQMVVCIDASETGCRLVCGKVYEVMMSESGRYEYEVKIAGQGYYSGYRFTLLEDKKEIMNHAAKKPHIHTELIKLWADGAKIECLSSPSGKYMEVAEPLWDVQASYRVKPEPTYPTTTMPPNDITEIYNNSNVHINALADIADAAIKHFIVNGDMDKYIESLK